MSDAPTEVISSDGGPPQPKPVYKQPWFVGLAVLLVLLVIAAGVGMKTMNDDQNAKVAAIQLQQKRDKAAADAAALNVKQAVAAAKVKAAAAAAAAKAKKQQQQLSTIQKDAAQAKKDAAAAQRKAAERPPTVVVPAPVYPPPTYVSPYSLGDGIPSGLLCRDLAARGLGYADAVSYWNTEGSPARMDADNDGIPCETVYARSDIVAYWGNDPRID
jgi:hypothetical protein